MTIKLAGFQELLDKANHLLKFGTYRRPTSKFVAYEYLTNKSDYKDIVEHYFEDSENDWFFYQKSPPQDSTIIMHGHKKGEPCAAPHLCHEYGFEPDPTHFPDFVRVFYQKWPQYGKQVSRSNRRSDTSSDLNIKFEL